MQILIYSSGFEASKRFKEFTKDRVRKMFHRLKHRISTVEVALTDQNGPKGGIDKSCIVKVKSDGMPSIVIKDVAPDAHTAVHRGLERVKRTLTKKIKKSARKSSASLRTHDIDSGARVG